MYSKWHKKCSSVHLWGQKAQMFAFRRLGLTLTKLGQLKQGLAVADKTRATCCIRASVLQTNNVDAQCDKLATKLSWQCFALEVANLQLPHLHLTYPTCIWRLHWGWPHLSFAEIFSTRKRVPGLSCCIVYMILCLDISVERWLVTVGQTHNSS